MVLFVLIMLLSSGVLALFVRLIPIKDQSEDEYNKRLKRIRTLNLQLWGATAVSLVIFFACYWIDPNAAQTLWVLSFILFFKFANPLIIEKNPGWGPVHLQPNIRIASLQPRQVTSMISSRAWILAWLFWSVGLLLLVMFSKFPHGVTIFHLFGIVPLLTSQYSIRRLVEEPEPLSAGEENEVLRREYESLRAIRARGLYALSLAMMLLFFAVSFIGTYSASGESAVAWIGGVGGSLLGICGGAFGVYCSFRKARLGNLYISMRR